jgi:hypothetical protein
MPSSAPWVLSQVQVVAEAAATIAFALSGVIEAARKRLDAVGICVVGGLAAFGGGTVRDVLLDRRPLFWVEHALWLWALLAMCIAAMLFMRGRHLEPTERAMHWPDAVGLGLFSANGTPDRPRQRHARHRRCAVRDDDGRVRRSPARHRLQRDPARFQRPPPLRDLLIRG